MARHSSLRLGPDTGALEILAFARAAKEAFGCPETRSLRAFEKTVVCKDGSSRKVVVLFVRTGSESVFEWLSNTWNAKEQRRLAAKAVHAILEHSTAVPPLHCARSDSGSMQHSMQSEASLPMRLTIASAQARLDPLASDFSVRKQALLKLRECVLERMSSRGHVSRGLESLAQSGLDARCLLRLLRFLLNMSGKGDQAQQAILADCAPVEELIDLLMNRAPASVTQWDQVRLQRLMNGMHQLAKSWRDCRQRKPAMHHRLVSNLPELAAIDWLLGRFSRICCEASAIRT